MTHVNTQKSKSSGGRPAAYTPDQVQEAVGMLVEAGSVDDVNASAVKIVLVERLGVTPGIDLRSLEPQVALALAARAEADERRILAALPDDVPSAVKGFLDTFGQQTLLLIARQNQTCLLTAGVEVAGLRQDKTNAHYRIMELEGQLEDRDNRIAALTEEDEATKRENAALKAEIVAMKAELDSKARDSGLIGRLRTELDDPKTREELRGLFVGLVGSQEAFAQPVGS